MITRLDEIVAAAVARGKKRLAVAYGQDTHTIEAVMQAILGTSTPRVFAV